METARFKLAGSEIVVEITCAPRAMGSYQLWLWERDQNAVVREWKGNFVNTDDDRYGLRLPNDVHDGRIVECLAVVSVPQGAVPVEVSLIVRQDGAELGRDRRSIPSGSIGQVSDLYVGLRREGA